MVFILLKPSFFSKSLLDLSITYHIQQLDNIPTSIDSLSIDQENPTLNFGELQMIKLDLQSELPNKIKIWSQRSYSLFPISINKSQSIEGLIFLTKGIIPNGFGKWLILYLNEEQELQIITLQQPYAQDNNGVILFPDISTYSVDYQGSTPINLGHNFLIAYHLEQSNYIYLVANVNIL